MNIDDDDDDDDYHVSEEDQENELNENMYNEDKSSSSSLPQEQIFFNKNDQKQSNIHQQEQPTWGNIAHNHLQSDMYQKQNYLQQSQKRSMMNQNYSQPIPSNPEQIETMQSHIPHMHHSHSLPFNQHKLQEPSVMKISPEIKSNVEHSMNATLEALALSFNNIPETQPERKYRPKNPCKTPDYYPSQPLPIFDKPAVFEKFDIDTLFFIFYHQQSTKQQYFASNELKKQSWRYHTKYLTWFRRHEEPKIIDKEYEEGTYVYFDYEINSWCQRKKSEFKFEYRYLEGQGT